MPRRVRRPKSKEDLLNKLTNKEDGGVFDTYKDVMLFAAALAAFEERSISFDSTSEPIDYNIFSKRSDEEALIHLLAIFSEGGIDILSEENSDERVTILENYSNAGLEMIEDKIKKSASIQDAILDLIHSTGDEDQDEDRDFSKVINLFKN